MASQLRPGYESLGQVNLCWFRLGHVMPRYIMLGQFSTG